MCDMSQFESLLNRATESICNRVEDVVKSYLAKTNFYNCTGGMQDTQEDTDMAHSRVKVFLGNDANGNPMYSWIGGATQDERNDNIVRAYYHCGRLWEVIGQATPAQATVDEASKHNFHEYAWGYYKRYKEPTLEANSKVREKSAINALCRFFGEKNVEDISISDVQDFMNARAESGTSAVTINGNVKTLRQILASAVEDGYCKKNVAASPRLTKVGRDTDGTQALSVDVMKGIIDRIPSCEDRNTKLMLAFLCMTGIRREEILGLQWSDLNMETNMFYIQRAVTYPNGAVQVKAPKSKAGYRQIPMPDLLVDVVKEYYQDSDDYIITLDDGKVMTSHYAEELWKNVREFTGLPEVTAKMFRTTYATMMAASSKVTTKKLQAIMGHAKSQTTMDVYAKVEKSQLDVDRNAFTDYVSEAAHT